MGQNAVLMKAASQDILRTGETQMRKRSGDFQVKKEHLVASSLPMRLRSFEKSLARHCAGTLIIDAKKHSTWMRYLDSDEWNFCVLKKLRYFRPNALICLKL